MHEGSYCSFEDHLASLANGLQLLVSVSTNDLNVVKQELDFLTHKESNRSLILSLDHAYSDLLQKMKQSVIEGESKEVSTVFDQILPVIGNLRQINDFLLVNINNLVNRMADQTASLELEDLTKKLICLKALLIYEGVIVDKKQEDQGNLTPLVALLDKVTHIVCLFWICIKYDEEMVLKMNDKVSGLCDETELRNIYLRALRVSKLPSKLTDADAPLESEFSLLCHMAQLLESCAESSNTTSAKLCKELKCLIVFFTNIPEKERLQRLHYFESSIEVVFSYSLPILYTCTIEDIEKETARELDGSLVKVLDQIEQIKLEVEKIKLFFYPKTDGLGFLGLFLEHLEELLICRPDAIETVKGQIKTLHSEFDLLISFFKITKEKLGEVLWARILHLAYQAEYLIDSYLVPATHSSHIISSLSEVLQQVNPIKSEVVMEFLVGGDGELDAMWMPLLEGSKLATSVYKASSVVQHFDVRAWCTVTQNYEKGELLLAVFAAVFGQTDRLDKLSYEELTEKLWIHLEQCKFLIVLEDVWDINLWNDFKQYLPASENGSRVLIATGLQPSVINDSSKVDAFRDKSFQAYNVDKSSSHVPSVSHNDIVVGFKCEAETIMNRLIGGELERDVVSIVGMPGIGKTTLALRMYNGSPVGYFDVQAWCIVSQNYLKKELLLTIIGQINQIATGTKFLDDQDLADMVCKSLRQRRYLIVLDDVWDTKVWNDLKYYFPDDKNSSRILITTRHQTVASEMHSKIHVLHELEQDESLELFQKKLLQQGSFSKGLLCIGNKIAKTCKGLPLSLTIIAGLLSKVEKSEHKWNDIAKCVNSHILEKNESNCMTILELSYNHLPEHLKSCFLYLGVFPEDKDISVSRLKLLWIGEGFVRETETESLEEAAERCLMDLVVRSLVNPNKQRFTGGVKTLSVHDLLHDFCIMKAREEHFFRALDSRHHSLRLDDPRRLTIRNCFLEDFIKLSCHSLRSLLLFDLMPASQIDKRVASNGLMLIKVLDAVMDNMPCNLSALIHLRYLAIQGIHRHDSIPSSIKRLHNLQILVVISSDMASKEAIEIPESIWEMVNLRHLDIRPRGSFQVCQKNLQKSSLSESLRTLSKLCVSSGDIEILKMFPNLQKLSCIFYESLVASPNCYRFPVLDFLRQLTSLKVEYGGYTEDLDERKRCKLLFPRNLKKCTLSGFRLLPEDFSNLGKLRNLEALKLHDCLSLFGTWNVEHDHFQKLTHLKLIGMLFDKWTASEGSFPRLEQLLLIKCEYLKNIPLCFGEIPYLQRMEVIDCTLSVDASAREIETIQQDEFLNGELQVYIISRKPWEKEIEMLQEELKAYIHLGDEPPEDSRSAMVDHDVDFLPHNVTEEMLICNNDAYDEVEDGDLPVFQGFIKDSVENFACNHEQKAREVKGDDANVNFVVEKAEKQRLIYRTTAERNLLAVTSKIFEENRACKRKDDLRKIITKSLSALNYDAAICISRWDKSPSYPCGSYEYIDVIIEGERILIDVDFPSELEIGRSGKAYTALAQSLPFIFVGKADRLSHIISVVSKAAIINITKKGMLLPPWRKHEYLKSKWLSSYTRIILPKDTVNNYEFTY